MADASSVISTTTLVAAPPTIPSVQTRQTSSKSRPRPSAREFKLLEENAVLSRQLVESNAKHIRKLEEEVERLKDALRETTSCNVLLYTSKDELSVAAVTNGTPEGLELFARADEMFRSNERELHKKGIAFAVIEDIPVNQLHETPFGSNSFR